MPADSADHRFLERPRVDRILEKALQSYVVTVVAGEGSGKTHAINSFLRKNKRNVTWIQLSEQDNLGWHLWENYIGEVARVGPETAKLFYDVGFPESDQQLDRYLSLLKDKTMGLANPYVTVFDDFHLITNPEVLLHLDRALAALVSNNPFVFISRTEPTIYTVSFLAKGILSEITVEDLRFTREETADYFSLNQVSLTEAELSRIFEKTEGWPLALGLILQEIKAGEAGGHSRDRVMRPIRNMEEHIFSSMGAELRRFLVKLSLIEHWSRNLLERLDPEGTNIAAMKKFSSIIRFDAYIQEFRIHSHFLDFLREQQSSLPPEEIREVYLQDARWCIEHNLPANAAADYERAGDCGGFVRLIESLPRMLPRSLASFFLEIAERLIASHTEDPLLRGEEDWDFLFLSFIVRARFLALLDRFKESAGEFRAGIARCEAMPPGPRRSRFLAAAYNRLGILRFLASRFTKEYDAFRYFERGCYYYLENPEPAEGQANQTNINAYMIQVGFPAESEEIDACIDACAAAVPYTSVSMAGYLYGADVLSRAELAYYRGDLNRAEQFARQAMYRGREKNQYEIENCALFYLMRIGVHRGDAAGVRELEQQMKTLLENSEYLNRYVIYDIITGRFFVWLGLTEKIAPWLRREREEETNAQFRGFDTLIEVRCLFAEKEYPAALRALETAQVKNEVRTFLLGFLEMAALEAVIRHRLGDREGALAALKKAYAAARPNAFDTPFIELGEHMHSLAGALLKAPPDDPHSAERAGIPREWLQSIRRSASANAKKRALVTAQYTSRETLTAADFSQHELAILNNLSLGRTSEEIAAAMHISVKMVKSAVRSLYVRLGAANRAGAIRAATERGLLAKIPGKSGKQAGDAQ
ncbi:MAG: LuxR C-terminal-related transcriptional regulator [Treponema sp.]|jgi:LuxR family maltose regulon positive regulatory protein|nr:LuxR C-terminal-related transcriptional regulator [Treponema sp.]